MNRLFQILLVSLVLLSCKNQKKTGKEQAAMTQSPDTIVMVKEVPAETKDSLAFYFEKTPCFGKCPVFKVNVYESGFATFEGINFTERLGLYSVRLTQADLEGIYNDALAANYFEQDSVYDNPYISDLPTTYSQINYNGKSHAIMARTNLPKALADFHNDLSVTLQEKDWKAYDNR